MATYDEIIEMFIERLKNPKLLPIMIRTAKCPNRNNSCKKKHGEIKIESFDKKKEVFVTSFYGIHDNNIVFQSEQTADHIRNNIKNAISKKLYDKQKLMNMMELDIERNRWVKIKLTDYEKIVLKKRAKADKTTMSHHARKKIFG